MTVGTIILPIILFMFLAVMAVFVILFIAALKKSDRKNNRFHSENAYNYNPYYTESPQNSCPSCGYAIKPDFRICPQCGTPLQNHTVKQNAGQDSEKSSTFDC